MLSASACSAERDSLWLDAEVKVMPEVKVTAEITAGVTAEVTGWVIDVDDDAVKLVRLLYEREPGVLP